MFAAQNGHFREESRMIITVSTVLACLVATVYLAYFAGETVVYTHFYYIPVVIAAIWYRRKGMAVPLVLVATYLGSIYASSSEVDAEVYFRSAVLIFVGLIIAELSNMCSAARDEVARYSGRLEDLVRARTSALSVANEKLTLMGRITRHDLVNSLSVLSGWLELARDSDDIESCKSNLVMAHDAEAVMRRDLEFAGEYERIGAQSPQWLSLRNAFRSGLSGRAPIGIEVVNRLPEVEILADPMMDKVFRNLIDNSMRHGGMIKSIAASAEMVGTDLVVVYTDDGKGISDADRPRVFDPGFGKHSGFGMYFAKKVLETTGISIDERGTEGKGARFVITVPQGRFRSQAGDGKGA